MSSDISSRVFHSAFSCTSLKTNTGSQRSNTNFNINWINFKLWWKVFLLWIYNELGWISIIFIVAAYRILNWFDWKLGHCRTLHKFHTPSVRQKPVKWKALWVYLYVYTIVYRCNYIQYYYWLFWIRSNVHNRARRIEMSSYILTSYNWNETTLAYFMLLIYLYFVFCSCFSSFIRFVAFIYGINNSRVFRKILTYMYTNTDIFLMKFHLMLFMKALKRITGLLLYHEDK